MEHYFGLGIVVFFVSIAVWVWIEVYRAKAALDEERIRRRLLEYELREAKRREELNSTPIDDIIEQRRNKSKKGRDD